MLMPSHSPRGGAQWLSGRVLASRPKGRETDLPRDRLARSNFDHLRQGVRILNFEEKNKQNKTNKNKTKNKNNLSAVFLTK